jgi:transposase
VSHANARTNLFARRLIVERVAAGWPPAHVAEQLGVSRSTVYKWLRRHAEGGDTALADRSSRPVRMPQRTSARVEQKVLTARRRRKRGAVVLAAELGLVASTVGRILARHHMPHLSAIDPITGESVRTSRRSANRYEHRTPGSLVHVDVKKLGRIPAGGGWRLHGRDAAVSVANRHKKIRIGYDYVHTAIDDHTDWPTAKCSPTKRTSPAPGSCTGHWPGSPTTAYACAAYSPTTPWSTDAARTGPGCAQPGSSNDGSPSPGCPWTNGKAERFNRTLLNEWAYARAWTSNSLRTRGLDRFLHRYNTRRGHSALGGKPPISRLVA